MALAARGLREEGLGVAPVEATLATELRHKARAMAVRSFAASALIVALLACLPRR